MPAAGLRLEVSDIKALARVLDKLNLEYSIISDYEADIFGEIGLTELAITLSKENCNIQTIHERNESLESYYVNLIGGENHE